MPLMPLSIITQALYTLKKLMATSSMARLNQKIITIVSFLTETEPIIFNPSSRFKQNTKQNKIEKLAEISKKLKKYFVVKKRAGMFDT